MSDQQQAVERIQDLLTQRKRVEWTIEMSNGETYSNNSWAIYAHDEYPRSSVLAGQPRRTYVWEFDEENYPGEAGKEAAIQACKTAGVWKYTSVCDGSTHIPVDQMVAHLPDDTDY